MMLLFNIWFWGMAAYFAVRLLMGTVVVLPRLLLYTLALPIMPFYVAHSNRKEHPMEAKLIYWLWGALYLLLGFVMVMELTVG